MGKRHRRPGSMQEAIRFCLDHAIRRHRRSVAQVGELIGVSEWAIYKWMHEGSMPSVRIRPFEFACGATFVTEHLAASAGALLVTIPTGRQANAEQVNDLHATVVDALRHLTRYYSEPTEEVADQAVRRLTDALREIASHRENVQRSQEPELELELP